MSNRTKRLAMARKRKTRIAQTLDAVSTGRVTAQSILYDTPDAMHHVRVWTLLLRIPNVGEKKAEKIVRTADIFPERRLGSLNGSERQALIDAI